MFTRDSDEQEMDVDSFFWRQVTARSPLVRQTGTPYDDAWRATNRLLVTHGSQASHERKVLLRNNGRGGFDEVSGTVGLDLDQDGRSFALLDYDGDGDSDVVLMSPRSSPQLRLFRNDFVSGNAALALRLTGTKSNRDAVGARVIVETDQGRATRIVKAGSGFISQHSKELLFGLGKSQRIVKVTIAWPSGLVQTLSDLPLGHRAWIQEGSDSVRTEPFRKVGAATPTPPRSPTPPRPPPSGTWLYQPYPAPNFTLRDLEGQEHSLLALAGRPVLISVLGDVGASLARGARGIVAPTPGPRRRGSLTPHGGRRSRRKTRRRSGPRPVRLGLPVMIAGDDVAGTYSILHRYLFDRREDLPLPTLLLLSAKGEIVKVYRESIAARQARRGRPRNRGLREPSASRGPCHSRARSIPAPANATTSSTDWSCRNRASTRRP